MSAAEVNIWRKVKKNTACKVYHLKHFRFSSNDSKMTIPFGGKRLATQDWKFVNQKGWLHISKTIKSSQFNLRLNLENTFFRVFAFI